MLVKWRPFESLVNLDPFFEDVFDRNFPVRTATFEPRIDVKETNKEYVLSAELPGLNKDDFKLTLENDVLTLEGEKKYEHEEKDENYYRAERSYGAFKRSFRLTNEVERDKIKADYKNGVLSITIPKAKSAQPKAIDISVS
ncbi:MAG: Hsp20/alpha crystallin family protein [bacterium]